MESESGVQWRPNQEFLDQLVAMGISHPIALEALFCSNNESVEAAINFVFSGVSGEANDAGDDPGHLDVTQRFGHPQDDSEAVVDAPSYNPDEKSFKMTFVVNMSLKMGTGKIAAQVAHACLGLYREMQRSDDREVLSLWEDLGEKKIVLKGDTKEHLEELYSKAEKANVPCHLVHDAGHTQIPAGSVTVLSVFGEDEKVNEITGNLSLL